MARKSKPLSVKILDTYVEYKDSGYPKDPRIYVIRVGPETIGDLLQESSGILCPRQVQGEGTAPTFMGFRVTVDSRLEKDVVVFGPETVEFVWEK